MLNAPLTFLLRKKLRNSRRLKMTYSEEMKLCKEQKKFGVTPLKKAVDMQKLKELVSIGFEKELAAESLRRNENESQKALDDLTNPDTNSDIQLFIESRKNKRLRRAMDSSIERLTSFGFPREAVVAAVRDFETEELALNHLLEQSALNGNAPPPAPVADTTASSSGSAAGSSSGATRETRAKRF